MRTFRLRVNNKIVGYERLEGSSVFYSKDNFQWSGIPIHSNLKDKFAGLQDKNDRYLFENDIILLRFKSPLRKDSKYRIRALKLGFDLIELENGNKESIAVLEKVKSIEFISYTFLNLDLIFDANKG